MKEKFQKLFLELVSALMEEGAGTLTDANYQSVLSTIYSLIEDDKLNDVDAVLRIHFPQYYTGLIPIIQNLN